MATTIQVRQRGTLTLPAQVRDRYHIQTGDSFTLVDFDGVLVLTPMAPLVPERSRNWPGVDDQWADKKSL